MGDPEASLKWLFVDLNSFFAAVEQQLRPELRGHPVGVVPVETEGTCIIAADQMAKIRGVKTGTQVREARRLCPEIRLVRARPAEYVRVHHEIVAAIDRCAPVDRTYSIDEWAIRVEPRRRATEEVVRLARRIKAEIATEHGPCITCSIGIAPTRLLAKIGSDLQKPNGLTVIQVRDLPGRLRSMALRDLVGIGGGIEARLLANNIRSIDQLWSLSKREAVRIWGSSAGARWWAGFHGLDEPEIPTSRHSMSHSHVLEPVLRNHADARAILVRLVCRLGSRLRAEDLLARTLTVHASGVGGGGHAASAELSYVHDVPALLRTLYDLWDSDGFRRIAPVKVGAVVSGLVPASQVGRGLFDRAERADRLSRTMDVINRRWGLSSIYVGSVHHHRQVMEEKIAFGRIPGRATV